MNNSDTTSPPSTQFSSREDNLVCHAATGDSTAFYLQLQLPPSASKHIQRKGEKRGRPKRWLAPRRKSPTTDGIEDASTPPADLQHQEKHNQQQQEKFIITSPVRSEDADNVVTNKVDGVGSSQTKKGLQHQQQSPVSVMSFMFNDDPANDDDSIVCLEDTSEITQNIYESSSAVSFQDHPEHYIVHEQGQDSPSRPCLFRSNSWSGRSNRMIFDSNQDAGCSKDGVDNTKLLSKSLSFRIRHNKGSNKKHQELTSASAHYLNGLSLLSPVPNSKNKSSIFKKTQHTFGGIVKGKFKLPTLPNSVKKKSPSLSSTFHGSLALESLKSPGLHSSPNKKGNNNSKTKSLSKSEHIPTRSHSDSSTRQQYDSPEEASNTSSPTLAASDRVVFKQEDGKVNMIRKRGDVGNDRSPQSENLKSSSEWAIKQVWKQGKAVFRNKKEDLVSQSEHILSSKSSSNKKQAAKQSKYQSFNDSSSWADLTLTLSPTCSADELDIKVSDLDLYVNITEEDTEKGSTGDSELSSSEPRSEPDQARKKIRGRRNRKMENSGNSAEETGPESTKRLRQQRLSSSSEENRSPPRKSLSSSRASRMRSREEHRKNNTERLLRQSSLRDLKGHRQTSLRDLKSHRQNSLRDLNKKSGGGARSLSRSRRSNAKEDPLSSDRRQKLRDSSKRQSSLRDLRSPGSSSCPLSRSASTNKSKDEMISKQKTSTRRPNSLRDLTSPGESQSYRRSNSNEEIQTPRRQNSLRDLNISPKSSSSSLSRNFGQSSPNEELPFSSEVSSPRKTTKRSGSRIMGDSDDGGRDGKVSPCSSREEPRRRSSMDAMRNDSDIKTPPALRREERRRRGSAEHAGGEKDKSRTPKREPRKTKSSTTKEVRKSRSTTKADSNCRSRSCSMAKRRGTQGGPHTEKSSFLTHAQYENS